MNERCDLTLPSGAIDHEENLVIRGEAHGHGNRDDILGADVADLIRLPRSVFVLVDEPQLGGVDGGGFKSKSRRPREDP